VRRNSKQLHVSNVNYTPLLSSGWQKGSAYGEISLSTPQDIRLCNSCRLYCHNTCHSIMQNGACSSFLEFLHPKKQYHSSGLSPAAVSRSASTAAKMSPQIYTHTYICRSQWPRGLRRRSAATRLLRSWVRISPGGMDVCLLCVVR